MYITTKGFGFVEEDSYKEGCLPETAFRKEVDIAFKGETKETILSEIKNFYGVTDDDIEVNACGEDGRIDIALLENGDGEKATKNDIEQWKQEKRKLYYVVYTHYLKSYENVSF